MRKHLYWHIALKIELRLLSSTIIIFKNTVKAYAIYIQICYIYFGKILTYCPVGCLKNYVLQVLAMNSHKLLKPLGRVNHSPPLPNIHCPIYKPWHHLAGIIRLFHDEDFFAWRILTLLMYTNVISPCCILVRLWLVHVGRQ